MKISRWGSLSGAQLCSSGGETEVKKKTSWSCFGGIYMEDIVLFCFTKDS